MGEITKFSFKFKDSHVSLYVFIFILNFSVLLFSLPLYTQNRKSEKVNHAKYAVQDQFISKIDKLGSQKVFVSVVKKNIYRCSHAGVCTFEVRVQSVFEEYMQTDTKRGKLLLCVPHGSSSAQQMRQ